MNNFLTKKVEKKAGEIERKGKKFIKRLKVYAVALGVGLFVIGMFLAFMNVSRWYDENRVLFQFPIIIKLQAPVRIEKRAKSVKIQASDRVKSPVVLSQAIPVPLTEKEQILAQKHGAILWKIYGLESTWGKADGCRLNNKGWGGFGVMNEGQVICYESFTKAVERAEFWLSKMNPDKNLNEALCLWNTGIRQPMCNYSISYENL
ncbi:MAG: hypothetical protein UT24_C0016G0027 [Candidatus Woesebacteria bacterium GW2011_GWB1_39_12]|uniref:Uncharacterized protein n=1 Tax=Candidatus Woesebacteria bacterium GW2011_GWB1_39_12 TaxID=1618574 RepID=A0A0G0MAE3_9BACT|nr:MAG: hypothetical protein UT24_C0016G0027 [Candidatus Woesebacteria bacterium GW2011_GWB1_39_12]